MCVNSDTGFRVPLRGPGMTAFARRLALLSLAPTSATAEDLLSLRPHLPSKQESQSPEHSAARRRAPSRSVQRLPHVVEQVFGVFEAGRDPYQTFADQVFAPFLGLSLIHISEPTRPY